MYSNRCRSWQEHYHKLLKAAKTGDVDTVQQLLREHTIDLNGQDREGRTALMLSAMCGHIKCIRLLVIDNRISVNQRDRQGRTALMLAAMNGQTECVKHLITNDNTNVHIRDDEGHTAFMLAAMYGRVECLQCFLDISVAERVYFEGDSDNPEGVKRTLDCRATNILWRQLYPVNKNYTEDEPVLQILVKNGLSRCVVCFLLGDLDIPLNKDICCSHETLADAKLCVYDFDGRTALTLAAMKNQYSSLEYLLRYERIRFYILVNLMQIEFLTKGTISLIPYNAFCRLIRDHRHIGDSFLSFMCHGQNLSECVDFLLSVYICQMDCVNKSAVFYAVYAKHQKCLKLLLEHISDDHKTHEHIGICFRHATHYRLPKLPLFLSAGIFHWSWYPGFPLQKQKHLARKLIINGYAPSPFEWQRKLSSPLHHAFMIGDVELVRYLVSNLYMTSRDLKHFQRDTDLRDHVHFNGSRELVKLHEQVFGAPWRLETMSFLTISTLLKNPQRQEDGLNLDVLPKVFRLRLAFMNPIRKLPVNEWNQIQFEFLTQRLPVVISDEELPHNKSCSSNDRYLRINDSYGAGSFTSEPIAWSD